MTNNDDNKVDKDDHVDDDDDDTPFRSSLLARQDWGSGFGGGKHTTGAREEYPNPNTLTITLIP